MIDIDKFIVKDWERWFTFKVLEKTDITDAEFVEILGNDRIAKMQKLQLDKEREQYEKLRPAWLLHASQDTQDYRKELEDKAMKWDKNALKEMEFFQWKFAYNIDWTVKLLKLEWGKTFCADLTGDWWTRDWDDADTLAKSKWYHLLTDWNGSDKQEDEADTDWYKLEQYFGDYFYTWAIIHMLGCIPGRYWTGTKYKNQEDVARSRILLNGYCDSYRSNTNNNYLVCGFKNSM